MRSQLVLEELFKLLSFMLWLCKNDFDDAPIQQTNTNPAVFSVIKSVVKRDQNWCQEDTMGISKIEAMLCLVALVFLLIPLVPHTTDCSRNLGNDSQFFGERRGCNCRAFGRVGPAAVGFN
jgi:hypothetical protein